MAKGLMYAVPLSLLLWGVIGGGIYVASTGLRHAPQVVVAQR